MAVMKIQQVIYVDILIVFNTVVSFFINLVTLELIRCTTKTIRLIIASFFGGISSLLIFIPDINSFLSLFINFVVDAIMVLLLISKLNKKKFINGVICSFIVTVSFGGIVLFIGTFFLKNRIVYNNGYAYFNIGIIGIITIIVFAYICLHTVNKKFNKKEIKELVYNVEINYKNKSVNIKAFFDTGNNVIDVYTGNPVILVNLSEMKSILDEAVINMLMLILNGKIETGIPENFRLLPVKTLASDQLLPAFTVDRIALYNEEFSRIIGNTTVAVTNDCFDKNNYTALISKSVLGEYLI